VPGTEGCTPTRAGSVRGPRPDSLGALENDLSPRVDLDFRPSLLLGYPSIHLEVTIFEKSAFSTEWRVRKLAIVTSERKVSKNIEPLFMNFRRTVTQHRGPLIGNGLRHYMLDRSTMPA